MQFANLDISWKINDKNWNVTDLRQQAVVGNILARHSQTCKKFLSSHKRQSFFSVKL